MKVLVCGGRDYSDHDAFLKVMNMLPFRPSLIIEGGAKGADRMARHWAIQNGVHYATVPALWDAFGRSAGHRRNSAMLMLNPEYCVALPGGNGTADMVRQCIEDNITVWQPYN